MSRNCRSRTSSGIYAAVASYSIALKRSAAKELERVGTKADRRRIVARIRALADDPRPRGCQKLSGAEKYRVRQGEYRIVYTIEDDRLVVLIIRVAHRPTPTARRTPESPAPAMMRRFPSEARGSE